MGHKRITEKDFWMCTNGAVKVQLQGTQESTTKKGEGEKYITVKDKATSSWIDFGCTKLMLIYALLAAAVVVIAALTVATGGAALIALGAIAGAAGAAWGAVVGGLLCGQKSAKIREWVPVPKPHKTLVQGEVQVTGDFEMTCKIPGGVITFDPNCKSWAQSIAGAAATYMGKIMEGMMAGAAIGMGGAAIGGGATAFAANGIRGVGQAAWGFARTMPKNFAVNAIESVSKFGLMMRGAMGTQNTLATYGNTGTAGIGDFAQGTVAMETGAYDSFNNIRTGQGTWQDYIGTAMMFAPVGQGKRDIEDALKKKPEPDTENANADDAESSKADDADSTRARNQEGETAKQEGEGEAYEALPKLSLPEQIAKSREAQKNAVKNHDVLPSSQKIKTTAKDGISTVSGHAKNRISNKTREKMGGVTDVPPKKVMEHSETINHKLDENSSIDNGVSGQSSASHAEKQIMTERPGDPIGVSKKICTNCMDFAQKQADHLGEDVIITDPDGTKIFRPGDEKPIDLGWD